jgi:hypothetical protein
MHAKLNTDPNLYIQNLSQVVIIYMQKSHKQSDSNLGEATYALNMSLPC